MKILIIGGGGREHALAWKLRQSAEVGKIWCAPGNGGISRDADCVALNVGDVKAAADLATKLGVDLTIVGPELPLVQGIADEFKRRGLAILGPAKNAAQLEGSKIFAKEFMTRNGVPTAGVYGTFALAREAGAKLDSVAWPVVVKADGLCAGKGVLVTSSASEAKKFIERLTNGDEFGDAGKRVLLEEGLDGKELSYIILTDGTNFISLAPTRDHKRAFDNDEGPNTGGMGTYSTDAMLTRELEEQILERIVQPTLAGLRKEGMEYRGFIFFGLMLTKNGPKVLEYNCRLGDPETQAILLRVVMASEGYPSSPVLGKPIIGLEAAEKVSHAAVFHAGTRRDGDNYYTSGGRILGVAAVGDSLEAAHTAAYDAASRIAISGAHYRKDIGMTEIKKANILEVRANG
jgi:phosphoribosylamine--glycine ligase